MVPSNKIVIHPNSVQDSDLPFFDGYAYLVTRVVPTLYHIAVLPPGSIAESSDIAHRQFQANKLPTCLVVAQDRSLFLDHGKAEWTNCIPRGGIPVANRLALYKEFP